MQLTFYKYHGAGNDFILVNNLDNSLTKILTTNIIQKLCERHFGIGANGLITIEKDIKYDFSMRYFNADGNESTMCGNGGRCIVAFANLLGIVNKDIIFRAADSVHSAQILSDDKVSLQMLSVNEIKKYEKSYIINTGSPHYIKFVKNLDNFDVHNTGKEIRYSGKFNSEGINVNFVERLTGKIKVRTYERGVEAETKACGTGAIASVIAYLSDKQNGNHTVDVITQGGILNISLNKKNNNYSEIFLTGPVKFVFKGQYRLI